MPAPDVRPYLVALIGETIPTIFGAPNWIVAVDGTDVIVGTERSPQGEPVPLAWVQSAADRVFDGQEVEITPESVGYRSAFIGAVLRSMPEVEIFRDPQRALARRIAGPAEPQEVGVASRNPPWEFDELILALDLYLRRGQPPTRDPDVAALSDLLNRLPIHQDRPDADTFRNPNGVHLKLANFKDPDPSYAGKGMSRGGQGVHHVWKRFADDREGLAAAVGRITATADGRAPELGPEEDEAESIEGRILFREHRVRERDPGLVKKKKSAVMKKKGRLACEACDLDFKERYGDLGDGFIECHHKLPLALGAVRSTTLKDLALVCSNCHRMLHRAGALLSVAELRCLIRA